MRKRFVNRTASCVLALSITALNIITCPAAVYAKQSELSEFSSLDALDFVSPEEKNKTSKKDSVLSEISEMNSLDEKDTNTNQINELSEKDSTGISELSDTVEDTTEDISSEDVINYFSRYGEDSEESEPVDVLMTESEFENFEDLLGDGAYFSVMAGSISYDVDDPTDVKCGNIATNRLEVPSNDSDAAALYKFGTKGPLVIVESSENVKIDINKNRLYTLKNSGITPIESYDSSIQFVKEEEDTEEAPAPVRAFVSGDGSEGSTGAIGAASDKLAKAYTDALNGNSLNYLSDAKWNKDKECFEIDCTDKGDGLLVFNMLPKSDALGDGNYNATDDYYDPDYGYEDDDLQAAEPEKKLSSYYDWESGNLTIKINPNQYILFVDNETDTDVEIGAINLEVNEPEGYEPPENMEYGYSQNLIWYFSAAPTVSLAKPNNEGSQFVGTFVAPNAAFTGRTKENNVDDSFIRIMANSVSGNTFASLPTKAEEAMAPPAYEIPVSQKLDGNEIPAADVDVVYGLENNISNFFYNNFIFCKAEVVQTKEVDNPDYEEGKPEKIIVEAPLESQPDIHKNHNDVLLTLGTDSKPYYIKLTSKNYLMSGYLLDESEYVVKAEVAQQLTAENRSEYTYVQGYDVVKTTYYRGASVADIAGGLAEDKIVGSIEFNHNTRKANEAQGNKYMPSSSDMVTAVLSDEKSSNSSKTKTPTKTPTPTRTPTTKVTKTPTPARSSSSNSSYTSRSSYSDYDYDYDYSSKDDTKKKDKDKDKDKKKVTPTPTKVPAAVGIKGINSSLGDYADAIASGAKSDKQRRDNSPIKIYLDESKPGNRVVVSVNQMQELKEQKAKYEKRSVKAGNYGGAPYEGAGADIKQLVSRVSSAVVPETPLGAVLFWIIPIIILALLLIRARSKWQGAILSKSDNGIVVKRGIEGDENSLQQYINMSEGIGESLEELRDRLRKSHTSSYLPLNMKMKIVLITPARATTLAICGANEEKMYSILSEYEDRECKMKVIFFKNERENCAELEFTFGNRKWNKETIFETKPLVLDFNAI